MPNNGNPKPGNEFISQRTLVIPCFNKNLHDGNSKNAGSSSQIGLERGQLFQLSCDILYDLSMLARPERISWLASDISVQAYHGRVCQRMSPDAYLGTRDTHRFQVRGFSSSFSYETLFLMLYQVAAQRIAMRKIQLEHKISITTLEACLPPGGSGQQPSWQNLS